MYNPKDHLKKLVEAHAPSGYEAPIAEILREDWADLVDEFDSDRLGSLIGVKRANSPDRTDAQDHAGRAYGRDRLDGARDQRRLYLCTPHQRH